MQLTIKAFDAVLALPGPGPWYAPWRKTWKLFAFDGQAFSYMEAAERMWAIANHVGGDVVSIDMRE